MLDLFYYVCVCAFLPALYCNPIKKDYISFDVPHIGTGVLYGPSPSDYGPSCNKIIKIQDTVQESPEFCLYRQIVLLGSLEHLKIQIF